MLCPLDIHLPDFTALETLVTMFKNLFGKSSTTADSGSEVDRYGSHFDLDKNGKEEIKKALRTPGVGAEQDRYQSHFGLEHQQIERAKAALLKARDEGAEKALFGSYWGLGADGQARLKALTSMGGVGAEQGE